MSSGENDFDIVEKITNTLYDARLYLFAKSFIQKTGLLGLPLEVFSYLYSNFPLLSKLPLVGVIGIFALGVELLQFSNSLKKSKNQILKEKKRNNIEEIINWFDELIVVIAKHSTEIDMHMTSENNHTTINIIGHEIIDNVIIDYLNKVEISIHFHDSKWVEHIQKIYSWKLKKIYGGDKCIKTKKLDYKNLRPTVKTLNEILMKFADPIEKSILIIDDNSLKKLDHFIDGCHKVIILDTFKSQMELNKYKRKIDNIIDEMGGDVEIVVRTESIRKLIKDIHHNECNSKVKVNCNLNFLTKLIIDNVTLTDGTITEVIYLK